jgi:diacylglycerol kinase family enzyme
MTVTQLIPAWKTARRLSFDAGIARGPWGERYFIEGAGCGVMTSAMSKASSSKTLQALTDADVKVSYAQQLVREHLASAPALEIEAALDGEDLSGRYLLFEALNIQYIGPNLFLAPDVARNNGEFEIVLIAEKHRDKLRRHIKHWQEGKRLAPQFETRRGKRLVIRWTGFKLHMDDKIWPPKGEKKPKAPATIEFEVEPQAATFLVPATVHELEKLAKKNPATRGRIKKS